MAREVQVQGYIIYACEECDFAYKDASTADACALHDMKHGVRSFLLTKKAIAPPHRHYQAVMKFIDEELKAEKAKALAAKKAAAAKAEGEAAPAPSAAGAGAQAQAGAGAGAAAGAAKPKLSPEELEARKKAALEKAKAAKAAREAQAGGA